MSRFVSIIVLLTFSIMAVGMTERPNVVVILADDLGYGDLSVQGHPLIRTPNIDRLAREGQRWTSFYASGPKCQPSRLAMMTGRLPIRIQKNGNNVPGTIPDTEISLGEMFKTRNYATAYIGKWGISGESFQLKGSHPNDQGFDYFLGTTHSNDGPLRKEVSRTYENIKNSTSEDFLRKLYKQRQVVEAPIYQPTITKRFTEESVEWIKAHKDGPFFLYLAHMMPHVPLFASPEFDGRSKAGIYGDVVEEIDWSVGEVIQALEEAGIAGNTFVFFSSDNGPWLTYYDLGGSPGPLRDGKMTGWEGAYRVPSIFWQPGTIKPSVVTDIGANVDLMSTFATLSGASLPTDRSYDSIDLSGTLLRNNPSPRSEWFYYGLKNDNLWGARVGDYKLVYESWDSVSKENTTSKKNLFRGYGNHEIHNPPLLFNLSTDIAERLNIAEQYPEIVADIQRSVERHQRSLSEGG